MSCDNEKEISPSKLPTTNVLVDVHPLANAPPSFPVPIPIMTNNEEINRGKDQYSLLLRNSILNEVLLQLPGLFEEFLSLNASRHLNDRSYVSTPGSAQNNDIVDTLEKDIVAMKQKNKDRDNKINGYETKLARWTDAVNGLESNVVELERKVDKFEKDIKQTEKSLVNKTKEYFATQKKVEKSLQETNNSHIKLKQCIDTLKTIDGKKIIEIEGSQEFVSNQYDNVVQTNKEIKQNIENLAKQVERNAVKSERNAGYSRMDCLELAGIPKNEDFEGKEDCKEMVKNICKKLHLSLRDDAISTAHRLKKHPDKTGPPVMIVKFNLRDDRNSVFALRKQLKTTQINIYGITNLFINESLTPEKKKLLYECKKFTREHYNDYGKIFVWSFKGVIYLRQNLENATRFQINYLRDLVQFENKCIKVNANNTLPKTIY